MQNPSRDPAVRLREWASYYHEHKDDPRSVPQQVAFNNMMIDGVMELMALVIAEVRQHHGQDSRLIYTPRGMHLEFDRAGR